MANGFNDWESLHSNHYYSSPSSSSSPNLSPPQITPHHHDLAIFPPVNHEGLPIPPPPPPPPPPYAPLSLSNSDPDSGSSSPPPLRNHSHFVKWFDFALHLWNSKLLSAITHLRSRGFFSSLRPMTATASFLVFLWFWVYRLRRWRRKRWCGGEESVEQLKRVIKEKDEKIIQLLEQIAQMNRVLLARYKIPVLRSI